MWCLIIPEVYIPVITVLIKHSTLALYLLKDKFAQFDAKRCILISIFRVTAPIHFLLPLAIFSNTEFLVYYFTCMGYLCLANISTGKHYSLHLLHSPSFKHDSWWEHVNPGWSQCLILATWCLVVSRVSSLGLLYVSAPKPWVISFNHSQLPCLSSLVDIYYKLEKML